MVFGDAVSGGAVWGVTTTHPFRGGSDVHGEVYWYREAILQVIEGGSSLEANTDRPGMDYLVSPMASASACQAACVNDAQCRAFSFSSSNQCSLKTGVPDWVPGTGTAGMNLQVLPNTNLNGGDYKEVDVGSQPPEACLALCAGESPRCVAYTFVPALNGDPGRCWLKSTLTSLSAANGLTSGVHRGLLPGGYIDAFSYTNGLSTDRNGCAVACMKDGTCRAYTFYPSGSGPVGTCLLMDVTGPWKSESGLFGPVSGIKRGLWQNSDRWGGDYARLYLSTAAPEACQAACANDSACKAFTYVPPWWYGNNDTAQCLLKSSVGPLVAGTGLVSGVKGAEFF
jgi:hypothetical protein